MSEETKLERDAWIEAVSLELVAKTKACPKTNMRTWATAMVKCYYDCDDDYISPKDAVAEELSYL